MPSTEEISTVPPENLEMSERMRGAPRIHGELLKLGIDIGESSVSKYMVRCRKPPSQTWHTFLDNHAKQLSPSTSSPCPLSVSRSFTCF
jgi:hypothetical protein